jgi:2-alkyl-3-oxoalkanoate reductase
MKNYDVAITGCTGFVGARLVRHFSSQGMSVLALGRAAIAPAPLLKFADYRKVDLRGIIEKVEAKTIIHAAALTDPRASFDSLYQVNVEGTKQLYSACQTDHFLYISSGSVYSQKGKVHTTDEVIEEDLLSPYGKSKRMAERWLWEHAEEPLTILRPRAVYGIGDRVLLPRILKLKRGSHVMQLGDRSPTVSLTQVENLIRTVEKAMTLRVSGKRIYNVSDPTQYDLHRVIRQLLDVLYSKTHHTWSVSDSLVNLVMKVFPSSSFQLELMMNDCVLDTSETTQALGPVLEDTFESSLEPLARWFRDNQLHDRKKETSRWPWVQ